MNGELSTVANNGISIQTMDDLSRVSKMLSASGYFKDAKDVAQCGVKVLAGLEMGVGAFAAMTGIHVIQGKPTAGAGIMAAAIKRHPKYDYKVESITNKVCRIQFFEGGEKSGVSEFTIEDAKAAGTQNLAKYPRNMLFSRAISNGVRWFCGDVFDCAVYTPEELGANVDGEGNVIDLVPEPSPEEAEKKKALTTLRSAMNGLGYGPDDAKRVAAEYDLPTSSADMSAEQIHQLIELMGMDAKAKSEEVIDAEVAETVAA